MLHGAHRDTLFACHCMLTVVIAHSGTAMQPHGKTAPPEKGTLGEMSVNGSFEPPGNGNEVMSNDPESEFCRTLSEAAGQV